MSGYNQTTWVANGQAVPAVPQRVRSANSSSNLIKEAPPRRALQQLNSNNSVSVLQRIKNFVAPPRTLKRQDSDSSRDIEADVSSNILSLPGHEQSWVSTDSFSSWVPEGSTPQKAKTSAPPELTRSQSSGLVLQSEDVMQAVMRYVDMESALKCRLVCKQWARIVSECEMDPLEAGMTGEDLDRGIQAQALLMEMHEYVDRIFTPEYSQTMATHLSRQETITEEMRQTLINWVTEVHFKFGFREPSLHLAVQIIDRYLNKISISRRKYQTVGVTALLLGCKFEERKSPAIADLSYITDYSSSKADIVDMEKQINEQLDYAFVQPKPADFVTRLAQAADIVAREDERAVHTFAHSIILFFIDVAALHYQNCGVKPSKVAAAAVSCALMALGRAPWNRKLAFYSGYESVDGLAKELLTAAHKCNSTCLKLKYSSKRFGGEAPDQTKGCYTFVRKFLESSFETGSFLPGTAASTRKIPSRSGVYV